MHPSRPDHRDDHTLLLAWRDGDGRAADELCDRHLPRLRRFLTGKIGPGPDVDELIPAALVPYAN